MQKRQGVFVIGGLILRSFWTGFFAACIVGPVFTLILYRAVTQGMFSGLASAAGMAVADGIFFFLAAMSGLTAGQPWLSQIKSIEVIGGPIMIFFGLWILLRKSTPVGVEPYSKNAAFFWQPLSALMLTLANPLTILFFGAVAGQIFPEIGSLSVLQVLLASFFLSLGSFALLSITIFFLCKQSSIDPANMMKFFKTLSGLGLLLTGCLLIFGRWASVRNWQKELKEKTPFVLIKNK